MKLIYSPLAELAAMLLFLFNFPVGKIKVKNTKIQLKTTKNNPLIKIPEQIISM